MCPTCGAPAPEGRATCSTCGTLLAPARPDAPAADYAVPASLGPARRNAEQRAPLHLWSGPTRTWVKAGCWLGAAALAVALLLPLVRPAETGADSPEAAVDQLLHGIADLDAVAILRVVEPGEVDDPDRVSGTYDALSVQVSRAGDVPSADITRVLSAAERQIDGSVDRSALATLAAVDLTLEDLELESEDLGDGRARVYLSEGTLGVEVDPSRLPDGVRAEVPGLGRSSYDMSLGEGWRRGARPLDPFLVAVEVDGRWYVSLGGTADELLGAGG